jgi:hypothetical protein
MARESPEAPIPLSYTVGGNRTLKNPDELHRPGDLHRPGEMARYGNSMNRILGTNEADNIRSIDTRSPKVS